MATSAMRDAIRAVVDYWDSLSPKSRWVFGPIFVDLMAKLKATIEAP